MEISLPHNWEPRWYQLPAWRYLQEGGRHAELIWHRRSGKDEIALHWASCAMMERAANYWHMLPEAKQARKAIWDAVNPHTGKRRIDEAFPRQLRAATREDEMLIRTKNGATWQVVGSDNFNSLVGAGTAGIVYSEWALANPAARAYFRPMIAENNGWQIFITTPRGRNHAYRTHQAALANDKAFAQVLRAADTRVLSPERLAEELREYVGTFGAEQGQALFDQEYDCSFEAAILGSVLGREVGRAEREGRVVTGLLPDPHVPIYVSSDIGFRDTAAWWFWQPALGGFNLIDYDADSGLDADSWVGRIGERLKALQALAVGVKLGGIWLPHDAQAKTFASRHSAIERFLLRFPSQVALVPPSKIPDRINAGRRIIGRCRFALPACEQGLEALRSWRFEFDEETRAFSREPKHDWASHPGDAFTYGAQVMEELAPPPPPGPPPIVITEPTIDEMLAEHDRMRARERRRI